MAVVAPVLMAAMLPDALAGAQVLEKLFADFANCVVSNRRADAKALVLAPEWWRGSARLRRLSETACGRQLQANQVTAINDMPVTALAGALVRADYANVGPATFDDRPGLAVIPVPSRLAPTTGKPTRTQLRAQSAYTYAAYRARNLRAGECIARAAPDGARRWVIAAANGPYDVAAPSDIAGPVSRCARQVGFTDIGPRYIALAYYRLANTTPRPANEATN